MKDQEGIEQAIFFFWRRSLGSFGSNSKALSALHCIQYFAALLPKTLCTSQPEIVVSQYSSNYKTCHHQTRTPYYSNMASQQAVTMNESSAVAPMDVDDAKSRVDQLLGNLLKNNPATAATRPARVTHRQVSEELVDDTKRRVDRLIRKLGKKSTPAVPETIPPLLHSNPRQDSITLNDPLHFLDAQVPPQ